MKLITNDASKNADNKEVARLKGVCFGVSMSEISGPNWDLFCAEQHRITRALFCVMKAHAVSAPVSSVGKFSGSEIQTLNAE